MVRTRVGYAGGTSADPSYHRMGDHSESVQVDFDPSILSYSQLLDLFWSAHQPAMESYSRQYMAAVFHAGPEQHRLVTESRDRIASRTGKAVRTLVAPLKRFYRAEDYHQKYSLRSDSILMLEFAGYSPQEFTDSTVAARLNGRITGQMDAAQFARELDTYGLSPAARLHLGLQYGRD